MKFMNIVILALFLTIITGCATTPPPPNWAEEHCYLKENGQEKNQTPQLGLTLSGGGTRAASYCIGVLKGLKELGVLDNVDVISSVSGGTYASYWYFSKLYEYEKLEKKNIPSLEEDEYFQKRGKKQERKEKGKKDSIGTDRYFFRTKRDLDNNTSDPNQYSFQRTLAYSSNIMNYRHTPTVWSKFVNYCWWTPLRVGYHVFATPAYWITNGLFDWEFNMSPGRLAYQHGLERTYGLFPKDATLKEFTNDESTLWFKRTHSRAIKISDFQKEFFLKNKQTKVKKWPYFIINSTGAFARPKWPWTWLGMESVPTTPLNKRVFEFTPWKYGSSLIGFFDTDKLNSLMHLANITSISGAAIDGQYQNVDITGKESDSDWFVSGFLNVVNMDIGYNMNNPNAGFWEYWSQKLFPFPFYWGFDWLQYHNDTGLSLKLSDGGQSENLGLYSLIRRGCSKIIVVDAEHDPNSRFGALHRLNRHLKKDFEFKDTNCRITLEEKSRIDVYDTSGKSAIIKGWVRNAPSGLNDGKTKNIELLYIKLSINPDRLKGENKYTSSVIKYAKKHGKFPHHSTADIYFSPKQFRAYRDLAYDTVIFNKEKFKKFKK